MAQADYMPFNGAEVAPNIAEIRIADDGVLVRLEVFPGDVPVFEQLIPDAWYKQDKPPELTEADRLRAFSENGLVMRRGDGRALAVSAKIVETRRRVDRTNALSGARDPLTGRTFPKPPDDDRVFYFELFYDFEGQRPDALTLAPPLAEDGLPSVTIGMIVFDRDVPVTNFRFLSGPVGLTIDWDDPWYSQFNSDNLKRHHQSGLTTYLYIEPREVRHEVLIRVRDLDHWLKRGFGPGEVLQPEALEQLKTDTIDFLTPRNTLRIDDAPTTEKLATAQVLYLAASGLQILEPDTSVRADAAFIGVIFTVPRQTLPDRVEVDWDMFTPRINSVPALAFDPAGPFTSAATVDDKTIVWVNHLRTYEDPRVVPIAVMTAVDVRILLLAVALAAALLVLVIVSFVPPGRSRAATLTAGLACLGAATYAFHENHIRLPGFFLKPPDAAEVTRVVAAVLENLSIADLEPLPDARDGELRTFVRQPALADVATELDRAFIIQAPGGGRARLSGLRNLDVSGITASETPGGFQAVADWSAVASAGHWGHSHRRALDIRALLSAVPENGVWMLDGITIIEAQDGGS